MQANAVLALLVFLLTVTLVIWRPKGIHEMIPAVIGGLATLALGLTALPDVSRILVIVSNAAITIISTFVMSSVLDQVGFFRWTAMNLARRAGGDGLRLWVFVLMLSIGMTLFLNNDGSILIATPIICELMKRLGLDRKSTTPFILGSAFVATASSAPIGVSNPANLEAMSLAGFNLTTHTEYMFLPSVLGLSTCIFLLWFRFKRDIPATYAVDALDDAVPVKVHPQHLHPVRSPQAHQLHPPYSVHPPQPHPLHAVPPPSTAGYSTAGYSTASHPPARLCTPSASAPSPPGKPSPSPPSARPSSHPPTPRTGTPAACCGIAASAKAVSDR